MMEKTYENLPRDQWKRIQDAAARYSIDLTGNTGQAQSYGVTLRWAFFPASQILKISILKSSMLSPDDALGFVERMILDS